MLLAIGAAACGSGIHSGRLRLLSRPIGALAAAELQLSVDKCFLCAFTVYSGIDVNLSVWRKSLSGGRHHTKRPAGRRLPNQPADRARIRAIGFRRHVCAYLGKEVRRRHVALIRDYGPIAEGGRPPARSWLSVDNPTRPSMSIRSAQGRPQRLNRGFWPLPRYCQSGRRPRCC